MKEKICFIICASNKSYLNECVYYIKKLKCPEKIEIEIKPIWKATSMCAGYNMRMRKSDAKYKVYLHQDVFIKNKNFISDVIKIFNSDSSIGMLGMVGGIDMPQNAVTYLAWNVGCVDTKEPDVSYRMFCAAEQNQNEEVDAVDGLLIATQVDIEWREDLFQGFDFYDISQSFEMRRAGYKLMVPFQLEPWVIHACNYAKLKNYNIYRNICINEYREFLTEIEINDRQNNVYSFFEGLNSYAEIMEKYMEIRFLLQRIECDMPEDHYSVLKKAMEMKKVSIEAVFTLIIRSCVDKLKVSNKLKQWNAEWKNKGLMNEIELLDTSIEKVGITTAYSKRTAKELSFGV